MLKTSVMLYIDVGLIPGHNDSEMGQLEGGCIVYSLTLEDPNV